MKYVNRKGDVYHLFQGVTKTGKSKYYVSRKAESQSGVPTDSLPADFELFESPTDATVSVRKKRPTRIFDNELQLVRERIELTVPNLSTRVICEGSFIVIYDSDRVDEHPSFAKMFGGLTSRLREVLQSYRPMSPALRFKLVSQKERIFESQRFCFLGSIDDWISLCDRGPLDELCQKYLQHLGKESIYGLM